MIQWTILASYFVTLGNVLSAKGGPREPGDHPKGPGIVFLWIWGSKMDPEICVFFNFVYKKRVSFCMRFLGEVLKQFWVACGTAGIQIISQIHGRVVQNRGFTEMEKVMCWVTFLHDFGHHFEGHLIRQIEHM